MPQCQVDTREVVVDRGKLVGLWVGIKGTGKEEVVQRAFRCRGGKSRSWWDIIIVSRSPHKGGR